MEYLAIALLSCLVGACSVQNTKAIEGEMPFVQGTPTKDLLKEMPDLINTPTDGDGNPVKITVAVYSFPDETGQRKQVGLSTAVSQGADVWVIQSLMAVGGGDWFSVVERASLDNLVKERQLIRSTRELYDGSLATDALAPMLFAGLILEGGIVGYDTNTTTTLNILEVKASKILTDFQGEELSNYNSFHKLNPLTKLYDRASQQVIPQSYIMSLEESEREYRLVQIGPNSFKVLGSPIEWNQ